MKRIMLYVLAAAAALIVPVQRTDIGKILPVEVVCISKDNQTIRIETDTGNYGEGATLEEAFREMEDTASGVIFLDTASYLLIRNGAQALTKEMEAYMKPWVRVCYAQGEIDLEKAREYLSIHQPEMRINQTKQNEIQEMLREDEGRIKLVEKTEKSA